MVQNQFAVFRSEGLQNLRIVLKLQCNHGVGRGTRRQVFLTVGDKTAAVQRAGDGVGVGPTGRLANTFEMEHDNQRQSKQQKQTDCHKKPERIIVICKKHSDSPHFHKK